MMAQLTYHQKNVLTAASAQAVERSFARLTQHFANRDWLGPGNRYRQDCVRNLKSDVASPSGVDSAALADYVAASSVLHCADGWGYLGRAVDALARGDCHTARHLGYYAELRAAVSLLATQGIGIFNRQHVVIGTSGQCQPLPGHGTHDITWLALEQWANRQQSTDLLASIVEPDGVSLGGWLDYYSPGSGAPLAGGAPIGSALSSMPPIGVDWLRTWGLDLQRLTEDREARNEASYRPTRLNHQGPLDTLTSSRFLSALWAMCRPLGRSGFGVLDRHLLRLSVEQAYQGVTDRNPTDDPAAFERSVVSMLELVPIGTSKDQWRAFLTRAVEPATPTLITEASGKEPVANPRHHIQVAARATLLLRVATGACAQLLRRAGCDGGDLEFWWKPLGVDLGLWDAADEPTDVADLWADVETALEEAREWQVTTASPTSSVALWRQEQLDSVSTLGACERIVLWGLGL